MKTSCIDVTNLIHNNKQTTIIQTLHGDASPVDTTNTAGLIVLIATKATSTNTTIDTPTGVIDFTIAT